MANKQLTYAEAIEELEKILSDIEEGEPDVDDLTKNVKRAAYLLRYCQTKLHKASSEVEEILNTLEEDTEDKEES